MTLPTASDLSELFLAIYGILTFVATVSPTSKVGLLAAKFAADIRNARTPAGKP